MTTGAEQSGPQCAVRGCDEKATDHLSHSKVPFAVVCAHHSETLAHDSSGWVFQNVIGAEPELYKEERPW